MKNTLIVKVEMPGGIYDFAVRNIGDGHYSLNNQHYGIVIGLRKFPIRWEMARSLPNGIELTRNAIDDIGEQIDRYFV